MTSAIWLGDLAVACAACGAETVEHQRRIAGMLGLGGAATGNALGAAVLDAAQPWPATGATADEPAPTAPVAEPVAESGPRDAPSPADELPVLEPVREDAPAVEPLAVEPLAVAGLPTTDLTLLRLPPPYEPLLPPRSSAAVLQALLGRQTRDGHVDVETVVALLADCRPVPALPRQPRPTLRYGAQVLLDRGDGLQPFRRDQAELVHRIRRLLGGERTQVRYFVASPLQGLSARPTASRRRYRLPAPDTKVLILSDFGAFPHPNSAPGASRGEWTRFVATVRHAGGDPVALVPYPKRRWPTWLPDLLPVVTWDRSATVGAMRASRR